MRRLYCGLIILFLLCGNSFAAKYYLFIEKKQSGGDSEKGDVVAVMPFTPGKAPTKAEKNYYKIKVVNLTDEEVNQLIEPVYEETKVLINGEPQKDSAGNVLKEIVRFRKHKVDVDTLKEKEEITNVELFEKVIIKPNNP